MDGTDRNPDRPVANAPGGLEVAVVRVRGESVEVACLIKELAWELARSAGCCRPGVGLQEVRLDAGGRCEGYLGEGPDGRGS